MLEQPQEEEKKEELLLYFLEKTREGAYAPIEESSLTLTRAYEETEAGEVAEEQLYYSIA
jgi:hypothetical protein